MKGKIKRRAGFSLVLLCLLLCFSLTACKEKKNPADKDTSQSGDAVDNTDNNEEKELTESQYYLVEKGTTEYQIVIPKKAPDKIREAAEELQYFLAEATGVTLKIVADSDTQGTEKLISLGWTSVAEKLNVAATKEDNLGISGYLIKTVADSVVIMDAVKGDGYGVLYGVYDLLQDTIGLKVYAQDEISYEKKESIPLFIYDDLVTPSFDVRSLSFFPMRTDEEYKNRMRLVDLYNWEYIGTWGHNQTKLLSAYRESHPEWFSAGGEQLCWSGDDEMVTALANSVITEIKRYPEGKYFHIAQEDYHISCTCEKCTANVAEDKYGSYSGLQIAFLNRVIEKVEAWREANAPERDIRYMCFAYNQTFGAPVKQDKNGKLVPYHEDCVPHDKLYIMIASLSADFSYEMEEGVNKGTYDSVLGWNAIAPERIIIYEYDVNFKHYFLYFNNFNVVENHYEVYSENGVEFMYSQGPVSCNTTCFTEMRIFVESQLMWDLSKNYDELVNEFMAAYYKDAAEEMRNYYDYIREFYEEYKALGGAGTLYSDISQAYTYDIVNKMDELIEKALQAIEPLREEDHELFTTLYYRIKKEHLTSLWVKLNKFALLYSEEELDKIATEFYWLCDEADLTEYTEGVAIGDMFFEFIQD